MHVGQTRQHRIEIDINAALSCSEIACTRSTRTIETATPPAFRQTAVQGSSHVHEQRKCRGDLVTATAHATSETPDGERLLTQILGEGRDDDGQLWALHRAIQAAVALPLDVHVVGEPLVLVAVEYDGNARRGLVAQCRCGDGSEHRIGLADVEMPAHTPGAHHVAAYRAWLGIVPDTGAPATMQQSRRQHKASDDDLDLSRPVELVVLAVKERAARCRLLGSGRVITLRAGSLHRIVAGHIVTVAPNKHWRHAGHPYLSGQITDARIDASALGLVPLALRAAGACDAGVEDHSAAGGRPRRAFELEVPPIPAGMAATNIDDPEAVAEKLLEADLRFLDAHAHLGGRLMGLSPPWALQHYEIGVGIGQLSIGDDFDGQLPGELAGNRGLLGCLSGYGSCLWRLERRDEATRMFYRALRLDPADRQGVRPQLSAMRAGAPWRDRGRS